MKPAIIISLSNILVCVTLLAQESPRPAGSGLIDRFKQFDRNGDGKLTRDEVADATAFAAADADKDGGVTVEEYRRYVASRLTNQPASTTAPPVALTPSTSANEQSAPAASALLDLKFTRDYFPGTRDVNGQWSGGTETLELCSHNGKLFASIGYWMDEPYLEPKGDEPWTGAQVLVRDSATAPWRVDVSFGKEYKRTEALVEITFTTDAQGVPLTPPVRLLVAAPNYIDISHEGWTTACTRDDSTGKWHKSVIAHERYQPSARSLASYRDKVTGVHHIFAGLNHGGIYRGSYDRSVPGGIRWDPRPERIAKALPGQGRRIYDYSRVLCFAECNGDLYMAARITTDETGNPVDGGLYRRVDGPSPRWELVYRWKIDPQVLQARFLRGLTAAPDPKGGNHQVLIANFEYPGLIVRFDPTRKDDSGSILMEQELDIKEFFNRAWNTPAARRRGAIAAYNRFLPVTDSKTGKTVWLCGAWVERPGSPNPPNNGSCYLIRHRDARYDWGYIYDPGQPVRAGQRLTGCRDIEPSPFTCEQGRVFYFCGYDGGAGPSHNTAWIYKGTLEEKP